MQYLPLTLIKPKSGYLREYKVFSAYHPPICYKMVGTPDIMREIANSCAGHAFFDNCRLPMAQKKGLGLVIQSMSVFRRKNRAVCQRDQTDDWFRLRLVL